MDGRETPEKKARRPRRLQPDTRFDEQQVEVLEGPQLIPLDTLRERVSEVPSDKPLVIVCQTGKRSGLATLILKQAGIARAADAAGRMVRWRELGLPP